MVFNFCSHFREPLLTELISTVKARLDQLEENEDFSKDEFDSDDSEDEEGENDHDGSEADVSTCSEDDSGVWVSDWYEQDKFIN